MFQSRSVRLASNHVMNDTEVFMHVRFHVVLHMAAYIIPCMVASMIPHTVCGLVPDVITHDKIYDTIQCIW